MEQRPNQYDCMERSTSPRSSTVSELNKSQSWKKQSLVGKNWEIYWSPDTQSIQINSSCDHSKRPPSSATTDGFFGEEESAFDADWYNAHVKSYLEERDIFEVSFVGEENKVHLMKLEQKIVRPLEANSPEYYCPRSEDDDDHAYEPTAERLPQHQVDLKWKDSLVGKDSEIFWESTSQISIGDAGSTIGYDEVDNFSSDWYDAHIESFNSETGLFQVSFVGEKDRYNMPLSQINVRPSARAWVRRTRFLLDLRTDKVSGNDGVVMSCAEVLTFIPCSTERFGNENIVQSNKGDDPFTMSLYKDLLVNQLKLKKELRFVLSDEDDDKSKRKNFIPNSEEHVEYLAGRIQVALDAATWFEHHRRGPLALEGNRTKLELQEIHSHIFHGIVLFLRTLVFQCDERPSTKKNKRMHPASPVSSKFASSKRNKKRRLSMKGEADFSRHNGDLIDFEYLANEVAQCELLGDGWIEIVKYINAVARNGNNTVQLSSGLIAYILRQFTIEQSPRFLSWQVSCSLQDALDRVWNRIETWICQATLAVGKQYAEKIPTIDALRCDETSNRCSLDDIQRCVKESEEDVILRKIDLSEVVQWLLRIVGEVVEFQNKAWGAIAEGMGGCVHLESSVEIERSREDLEGGDAILTHLEFLTKDKACPNQTGIVQDAHVLTAKTIETAISIRKWIIFYHHTRNNRERIKSIEEAYSQRPTEPLQIPAKYNSIFGTIQQEAITEYVCLLLTHAQQVLPMNWNEIQSECDCRKALEQMSSRYFLLKDEEKAAVLSDAFAWSERAKDLFQSDSPDREQAKKIDFKAIEALYKESQSLKKGKSKTRLVRSISLLLQTTVDLSVSTFAKQQISLRFGEIEQQVVESYTKGSIWCKKANIIIRALRHYGNVNAHLSSSISSKVNNMVDLKLIDDLVKEHEESIFNFPENSAILSRVSNDANAWVRTCLHLLPESSASFLDPKNLLNSLQEHIAQRPKGIVMFPSRQLVSEWVDLLDWYCQCSLSLDVLRTCHETKVSPEGEMTEDSSILLQIVNTNGQVETLLRKGIEIISAPPSIASASDSRSFQMNITTLAESIKLDCAETTTPISLAKIRLCWHSTTLLCALESHDHNLEHRGVLFVLKLFLWKHEALSILSKVGKNSSQRGKNNVVPSLEEAKSALDLLNSLPDSFENLSKKDNLLASVYSTKYSPLYELISDSEQVSKDVSHVLDEMNSPNLFITNEYIEVASAMLRSARSRIKAVNDHGLGIDSSKTSAVEKCIRDFNWLKTAFDCPVLRDTKYSSSRRGVNTSDSSFEAFSLDEKRISLSAILQMYEKAPPRCRSEGSLAMLDSEMKSMFDRTSAIKDQISQWQAEVQTYIPRALRLSKRRINKARSMTDEECDIVSESELRKFLQHPLLRYISMPEEEVIQDALAFTMSMAERMAVIFGRDHHGKDVDRSCIPQYASLLGETGEFYLYRVIHSPEYLELKAELEGMESYANSLPVRTLDKETYSWITKVVKWIESVANAVVVPATNESNLDKSYISLSDSIDIINKGQLVFLGLPDESKKYLLDHRLSVSVRSSTGKFHVKNCKGGSNHSIGCTVLKWIAFCYNGLRNDLASTEFWTKRVDAALKPPNYTAELRTFLEEARDHLVISPDDVVLDNLISSISNCSPATSDVDTPVSSDTGPVFVHNLLMHYNADRETQS